MPHFRNRNESKVDGLTNNTEAQDRHFNPWL